MIVWSNDAGITDTGNQHIELNVAGGHEGRYSIHVGNLRLEPTRLGSVVIVNRHCAWVPNSWIGAVRRPLNSGVLLA